MREDCRLPAKEQASRCVSPEAVRNSVKKRGARGNDIMEFTLTFIPYMMLVLLLIDVAWAIFAKSVLMYAVRTACRTGITVTGTEVSKGTASCGTGADLTTIVKSCVEANSMGLLTGSTGLNYIQVHYYTPCSTSGTGMCDVSTSATGDAPYNVMQVGVYNFPLPNLASRIYGSTISTDHNPAVLSAISADEIEPSGDVPPIGTAP